MQTRREHIQSPLTWNSGSAIFLTRIFRNYVHIRSQMKGQSKISSPTFLSLLGILLCISCAEKPTYAREDTLRNLFSEAEITIAIVDSGLGGLSILADAAQRLKEWKIFQKVDFVYFNALFANEGGYNALPSHQEKTAIFDSALESLEHTFSPDLILIGCNTLSSIYDDTNFARGTKTPVRGIIESGVELAYDALKTHPGSKIILFATQTTVAQNTHKDLLMKRGFLPERIVCQACPELSSYIEADYKGEETDMLIIAYVDEALKKISDPDAPLLVSFNCTHFGYSLDLWKKAFHNLGVEPIGYLDPNARMNDFLFRTQYRNRHRSADISVRVVSMVSIDKKKVDSLGSLLHELSPETAEALEEYEWIPDLFRWRRATRSQDQEPDIRP